MPLIQKRFIRFNGHADKGDYDLYKQYSHLANEERIGFLRNLFSLSIKARQACAN